MPLLNDATAVFVGATAADRVYVGSTLVWPTGFDFHVDSVNGSNTADGLTPATAWQTLAKATTSATLGPGARIGLARGSLFRETWNWPASTGTESAPVVCGAYGAGAKPRISGANVVAGTWTPYAPAGGSIESLVNGGFETWTNSTTPGTWVKSLGGTSTVTQETTDRHGGASAIRTTVDAVNSGVGVNQTVSFTAGQPAVYSFWHKIATGTPSIGWQVRIQSGTYNGYFLQANGTWSTTDPGLQPFASGASWAQFSRSFTMPDADGTVRVSFQRSNGSCAYLVDDASLAFTLPGDPVPDVYQISLATQPYVVTVNGVKAPKGTSASLTGGQWWWSSGTLYLHSTVAPAGLAVEAGARDNAVYLHETPLRPNVRFENIRFELSNDTAVSDNKNNNVELVDCEFYGTAKRTHNGAYAVSIASGGRLRRVVLDAISNDGIYGFDWYEPLVEDCEVTVVSGDSSDCMQLDYATEPSADTNWVVRNTLFHFEAPDSPKGCFITFGSDGLFEHNECNGGNFGTSMAANDITVRDCVYRDQLALGALRIADNNSQPLSGHLYERVTIIRPQYGIMIESPSGNPARSNLTYDHLTLVDATSRAVYIKNQVSGTIRNSVLWAPDRTNALVDVVGVVSGQTFTLDTCVIGPELPGVPLITWGGVAYNTLAAFTAAHPGIAIDCQVVDPEFVDEANENYTPAAGSPLIGAGTDGGNIGAI